jgi:hypothetical protein
MIKITFPDGSPSVSSNRALQVLQIAESISPRLAAQDSLACGYQR